MNSKQIVFVLCALVFAVTFAQASDDSSKCMKFAEAHKGKLVNLDQLANVKVMRMYGPPKANKSCTDVCESKSFNLGFEYAGKQACCCGNIEQ